MRIYYWLLVCLVFVASAETKPTIETQAEYDLYNAVVKDFGANDFNKALVDLAAWEQKFPDSKVRNARQFLFVQAHYNAKQPAKVLEIAATLDPAVLDSAADQARLLYSMAAAIQQIPAPTPAQLAAGEKAARALAAFDKTPDGVKPEEWAKTRTELRTLAANSLRYIALSPVSEAMAKQDCPAAEAAARKALESYPESAQAAWYLGTSAQCQYKTQPEKATLMLYEFARAASLDPAKSAVDPKWQSSTVEPHFVKIYKAYHGDDAEGMKQLRQEALKSPLPPEGFVVKSAVEIEKEKQDRFASEHPELALWTRVKQALQAGGDAYFESDLKDRAVPQLKGVVVDSKPACKPKELTLAVPMPSQAPVAEIVLKLEKPLAGKVAPGTELTWEGVPTGFAASPFLLTMETTDKPVEVAVEPCAGRSKSGR